jgi:hypothetical protein
MARFPFAFRSAFGPASDSRQDQLQIAITISQIAIRCKKNLRKPVQILHRARNRLKKNDLPGIRRRTGVSGLPVQNCGPTTAGPFSQPTGLYAAACRLRFSRGWYPGKG